jgi:hypothetical protein
MITIQTVTATTQEKAELDKQLIAANIVFRKYFDAVKEYLLNQSMLGVCVNRKYGKTKFKKELELAYLNNPEKIIVRTIEVPKEDFDKIFSIKKLEEKVLSVYGKLLYKKAHWWVKCSYKQFDLSEAYQECVIAALTAMWGGFSKEGIKFITFLHKSIQNRFYHVTNENKPLSPWSFDDRKLLGNFKKLQKLNPNSSFDELVEYMNLNEDQIDGLHCMLKEVKNESVLSSSNDDFSFYDLLQNKTTVNNNFDIVNLLEKFEMSEWERICINAYLNGKRGWAAEIAREHINPVTQTTYSRAAPQLAVDRVLERFKIRHFSGINN